MALSFATPLFAVVALLASSFPVIGQEVPTLSTRENASELPDTSLSHDCRVPGSKLYALAQLKAVRAALDEKRPLKVLALGPSGTSGVGSGSGSATYPSRLEEELQKRFSGIDVVVEHRSLPGDITADAIERFTVLVTEIEPNLIVWQVGTNDALAKADVEAFTGALAEILQWLNQHDIDAVLIEPPTVWPSSPTSITPHCAQLSGTALARTECLLSYDSRHSNIFHSRGRKRREASSG